MSLTLYERLGGEAGISALVVDVRDAHLANPVVRTLFENANDLERAIRMSVQFFCAGSAGPKEYMGTDMLTAHRGMNISQQENIALVDDILGAMKEDDLGEDVQKDVLAILYSLKDEIIRVQEDREP